MLHPSASAPSPRCGTSEPPQHQTDPQQSAPQSDPRDPNNHAPHPLQKCKAPQQPQKEQAPNNYPKRTRACSISAAQSAAHRPQTMSRSSARKLSSPSARRHSSSAALVTSVPPH